VGKIKGWTENWANGSKTDDIKAKLDARRPGMETVLTAFFADQMKVETLVRGVLAGISSADVLTIIQSPFYQAAAKQLAKGKTRWGSGAICDSETTSTIAKWSGRGLSAAVLMQIAYKVFGWTPPDPQ
jgi:hypothetical protein